MLAAGVPVSLGTDGYVNNYFALMRGAFLIHKAHSENPQAMPAHLVWKMATLHGAHDLNMTHDIGQLKPGYSADFILIDADTPTPLSANNLMDQMLLWRDPINVRSVMCAGRWLMRDREVVGVDEARVRAKCREAAQTLWTGME